MDILGLRASALRLPMRSVVAGLSFTFSSGGLNGSVVRNESVFLAGFRRISGKRVSRDGEDMRVNHHIDVPQIER